MRCLVTTMLLAMFACAPPRAEGSLGLFDASDLTAYCARSKFLGAAVSDFNPASVSALVVPPGQTFSLSIQLDHAANVETALAYQDFNDKRIHTYVASREDLASGDNTVTFPTDALPANLYSLRVSAYASGYASDTLSLTAIVIPEIDAAAPAVDLDGDCLTPRTGDCDETNASVSLLEPEQCSNGIDDDCNGAVDDCL